jgi:hypothetical protein
VKRSKRYSSTELPGHIGLGYTVEKRPFGGQVADQSRARSGLGLSAGSETNMGQAANKRGLDLCGQATKGAWGMSWRQEALKGVEDCEKLGGTVKRVLIPRYPNRHALNS